MKFKKDAPIILGTPEDLLTPYQYWLRWCAHNYLTTLNPTVHVPRRLEPVLMEVVFAYYKPSQFVSHTGLPTDVPTDFHELFGGDVDMRWLSLYKEVDSSGLTPRYVTAKRNADRIVWIDAFMQAFLANYRHIDLGRL